MFLDSHIDVLGCRQPYITHSKQLEVCLKAVDSALLNVEDVIVSARSESGQGHDITPGLAELHQAYVVLLLLMKQVERERS